MIAISQEVAETDDHGKTIRVIDDSRSGSKVLKVVTKRIRRVFMNYTLIKRHETLQEDASFLVSIKKERRARPQYIMVVCNAQTNTIQEVREIEQIVLILAWRLLKGFTMT